MINNQDKSYLLVHLFNFSAWAMLSTSIFLSIRSQVQIAAAIYSIPILLTFLRPLVHSKLWMAVKIIIGTIFVAGFSIILIPFSGGGGGYGGMLGVPLMAIIYSSLYLWAIIAEHKNPSNLLPFKLTALLLFILTIFFYRL